MSKFDLRDWNDVRLVVACAEHGSFAAAAVALGLDQTTVSRRIGVMEAAIGRPLFTRRRSGATPTPAGEALLERARLMERGAAAFEEAMRGLSASPAPAVAVGANDGLLSYTIIPTLLGHGTTRQPLDRSLIRHPLPTLAFTTEMAAADIAVVGTSIGDLPPVKGAMRVRRIGTINFAPATTRGFANGLPPIDRFDDLRAQPMVDVAIYRSVASLDGWNALVDGKEDEDLTIVPSSAALHRAVAVGKGIALAPRYCQFYHEDIVFFDVPHPRLGVALWLVAHEDKLREPATRRLYDTIGAMFLDSPWYRSAG